MKVIDILAESIIDEAPAGALGQIGRRLGSAALGAAGLRTFAADLGGRADMGDRANQYYTAFRRYLAQSGKTEKSADYTDLVAFLKKSNLDTKYFAGKKGTLDPSAVNKGFTAMAKDYFKGDSTTANSSRSSTAATAATANTTANTTAGNIAAAPAASQPFSVPALLQVIPQMKKNDLVKIQTAVVDAIAKKPTRSIKTNTASTPQIAV